MKKLKGMFLKLKCRSLMPLWMILTAIAVTVGVILLTAAIYSFLIKSLI
jgi:hypothetical protein